MAAGTLVIPHGFSEPNVGHLTATDVDTTPREYSALDHSHGLIHNAAQFMRQSPEHTPE